MQSHCLHSAQATAGIGNAEDLADDCRPRRQAVRRGGYAPPVCAYRGYARDARAGAGEERLERNRPVWTPTYCYPAQGRDVRTHARAGPPTSRPAGSTSYGPSTTGRRSPARVRSAWCLSGAAARAPGHRHRAGDRRGFGGGVPGDRVAACVQPHGWRVSCASADQRPPWMRPAPSPHSPAPSSRSSAPMRSRNRSSPGKASTVPAYRSRHHARCCGRGAPARQTSPPGDAPRPRVTAR
jgi:hypothetical protein